MSDYIQFIKNPDTTVHRQLLEKALGGPSKAQVCPKYEGWNTAQYGFSIINDGFKLNTPSTLIDVLRKNAFLLTPVDPPLEQISTAHQALFHTKLLSPLEGGCEESTSKEGILLTTTDIENHKILEKLEAILGNDAKVVITCDKKESNCTFLIRVLLDGKLLNKNELLGTLQFCLVKAQEDLTHALGSATTRQSEQAITALQQQVDDILNPLSLLATAKDTEKTGWRRSLSKVGKVASAALFGMIKGVQYLQRAAKGINIETLALCRRIGGTANAVLKANRTLRKALTSKDQNIPPFTALYRQYQKQPEILASLNAQLVKKNDILEAAFASFKNIFRSKAKVKIRFNNLLKSALMHQKFADANFIIKNKLYAEVTDDLMKAFSNIPYASEADKREVLTNLFQTAPNASSKEKIIDYLIHAGRTGYAIELVEQALLKGDCCCALAARIGDPALIKKAFGFDVDSINIEEIEHLPKIDIDLLKGNNPKKRTLLHDAVKGGNAKFIRLIALCTEKQVMGVKNAFMVKDEDKKIPAHSIGLPLAQQLDELYKLDGNKRGSFCSMAFYIKRTRLNVSSIIKLASEVAGKGFGAAASTATLILSPGLDVVTNAITLHGPTYGGMGVGAGASLAIQSLANAISKLHHGTQLNLSQYEAMRKGKKTPFVLKAETKKELFDKKVIAAIHGKDPKTVIKTLNQAVKRRDVGSIFPLMLCLPENWKPSAKFLQAVNQVRSYPSDLRGHIMDFLFERCDKPDLIEKMMDVQLQFGGSAWVKDQVMLLKKPALNIDDLHKKPLLMMAAKLGMHAILKSIDFPDDVIEWQNRKGETMLHLAAQSNHVPTIVLVAKKMQERLTEIKPDNKPLAYKVARQKQTAVTLKEGLSAMGFVSKITGRKILKGFDVFCLQNGHGKAVQDIIPRDLMNRLDDYLLMRPNESGSLSDIGKLRAGEIAAEWVTGIGLVLPAKTALNFALANTLKVAVTSTFVTASATHGILPGLACAWAVEFACRLSLMVVGIGIEFLMNWQTGMLLYDLQGALRGYDNVITQLGATSKEVLRRLQYSDGIDREQKEQVNKKLNPILAQLMHDVVNEAGSQPIFEGAEALQHLQNDLADCFAYNRSMPDILAKIVEVQKQAGFSEEQNKALSAIILQQFDPSSILKKMCC